MFYGETLDKSPFGSDFRKCFLIFLTLEIFCYLSIKNVRNVFSIKNIKIAS